jgi:hypothetical protein
MDIDGDLNAILMRIKGGEQMKVWPMINMSSKAKIL